MAAAPIAFEAVHREFHPKVVHYLAGMVGEDDAADLAQVTMIKVAEHLAEFRGECALSTWIYRIATNVAIDRLRQRTPERVPVHAESDDDPDEPDRSVPPELRQPSAESTAMRREMSACVREFVDRLPANYRTVLVLSDIEGFTDREIAEITGSSLETVKIRLHRARLKLRAALDQGCTIQRDDRNEVACDRRPAGRTK
jgi:RNA polymerase sigma-70 factor, ECF subfamily